MTEEPAGSTRRNKAIPTFPEAFFTRLGLLAAFTAAVVNIAYLTFQIQRYAFRVPFQDAWLTVDRLTNFENGEKSWAFFSQWVGHHRSPFPRFIELYLASWSGWDLMLQVWFNYSLAILAFAILLAWIIREKNLFGGKGAFFLTSAALLLVFSAKPYIGWMWVERVVNFTSIASSLAGLFLLTGLRISAARFAAAAILGFISLYSFSSGLLFWPAGFFMLAFKEYKCRRFQFFFLAGWLLLACAVLYSFIYLPVSMQPPGLFPVESGLHASGWAQDISFVLIYLGGYLSPNLDSYGVTAAWWCGFLGLQAFTGMTLYLYQERRELRARASFATALGIYALGCACLTAVARAHSKGLIYALEPYHMTLSYFFWFSLIGTALVLIHSEGEGARLFKRWAAALITLLFVFLFTASFLSMSFMSSTAVDFHNKARFAFSEILAGKNDVQSGRLFWVPIDSRTRIMQDQKWSVFRDENTFREFMDPV